MGLKANVSIQKYLSPPAVNANAMLSSGQVFSGAGAISGFPPLAAEDPSIIIDIGCPGLNGQYPKSTWATTGGYPGLPSGMTYTSSTGSSISNTTGYVPGNGNNAAGRIDGTSLSAVSSASGTVYLNVSRPAACVDTSQSSSSSWYESNGNTLGASPGSYPPCLFCLCNSGGVTSGFQLLVGPSTLYLVSNNNFIFGQSINNVPVSSVNSDPNYWDIVFTWTTVGSNINFYLYIDGQAVYTGTIPVANWSSTLFYEISIGNGPGGANSFLGGNLGPFTIRRFQVSSAYFPPPTLPLLVGFYGDSYSAGGGVNGDGGVPGTATVALINAAQYMVNTQSWSNSILSGTTQLAWQAQLASYFLKQLGGYPSFFGACKSGYSSYFTTTSGSPYNSSMDNPSGISQVNNAGYVTYCQALDAAQPQIIVYWDNVNNAYESPTSTGLTADPVGDLKWHFNKWADNNPRLQYIVFLEQMSLELMPAVGALNPTTYKTISANWRPLWRSAFYSGNSLNPVFYAGRRQVPVLFVPTYERMISASDGNQMLYGSNPNNICTSGSNQGPSGASPDIHPSPYGRIVIADLCWQALKPAALAVLNASAPQVPFIAGNSSTAFAPNCCQGGDQVSTMNSNLTVGAPINAPYAGFELTLTLIQDSTGNRALAWNSTYRNAPTISAGAAGTRGSWKYKFDGVNWQYQGGSTAFA